MKIFKKLFKTHSPSKEWPMSLIDASNNFKIHSAYEALTKVMEDKEATEINLVDAIEEAIGYLGEVLE
jgi:hypothetical protein